MPCGSDEDEPSIDDIDDIHDGMSIVYSPSTTHL